MCPATRLSLVWVMTYTTVFDASQHRYENFWSLTPILIFVALGAMLVFRPVPLRLNLPQYLQERAGRIFSWCFFIFSLLAAMALPSTLFEYHRAATDLRTGRYSVVEGPVANFVPMPYQGHAQESFTVNGHRFSYSDYIMTAGFRNTASHGGPIREGLYVRISYSGNLILRLEVAQ
jgi:hypothetical protein